MSVYVDDMYAEFGNMLMCHMYADTHDELVEMADRIGVRRKWIQYPGDPVKEHFDIAKTKRSLAVRAGAIETTWMDYGRWVGYKREAIKESASTLPTLSISEVLSAPEVDDQTPPS